MLKCKIIMFELFGKAALLRDNCLKIAEKQRPKLADFNIRTSTMFKFEF